MWKKGTICLERICMEGERPIISWIRIFSGYKKLLLLLKLLYSGFILNAFSKLLFLISPKYTCSFNISSSLCTIPHAEQSLLLKTFFNVFLDTHYSFSFFLYGLSFLVLFYRFSSLSNYQNLDFIRTRPLIFSL